MEDVNVMIAYAMKWVGTPYKWGGDDPSGIDCSGLVQECLESVGKNPPGGDKTADGIYYALLKQGCEPKDPDHGSILFFGNEKKITHTAIALSPKYMIEAGGGGSKTTSEEAAWAHNAWVRIRPINARSDLRCAIALDDL